MACDFGLPELVNHNAFIKDLEETGYLIDFIGRYLVILRSALSRQSGQLQHGDWASPVDLNGAVIDPPQTTRRGGAAAGPVISRGASLG